MASAFAFAATPMVSAETSVLNQDFRLLGLLEVSRPAGESNKLLIFGWYV